jgi:hypothetical protein
MNILPPYGPGLSEIDVTSLHRFIIASRIIDASSFKLIFLLLLLLHPGNSWTFAMHWKFLF